MQVFTDEIYSTSGEFSIFDTKTGIQYVWNWHEQSKDVSLTVKSVHSSDDERGNSTFKGIQAVQFLESFLLYSELEEGDDMVLENVLVKISNAIGGFRRKGEKEDEINF